MKNIDNRENNKKEKQDLTKTYHTTKILPVGKWIESRDPEESFKNLIDSML